MYDFKKTEADVLKFWKEKRIYEKSREKNKKGKKFYMMDGPPYANGNIHMGHALNKTLKDIAMRSRRMQGFNVFDRAGYDTHGLPIEYQVEKEIGSKTKKDIEKFGVKRFIERCKEFATQFIGLMNSQFEDLGVWMDFKNPYLTLTPEYIETIWETFKVAEEKGLLYLGKYPVHVCPRCETAVAYNEIEYAKQDDASVFVKFPLKEKRSTFLIIWTTTAWTLPGNTGVMANPNFAYAEIELSNGERWIMAKELVPKLMGLFNLKYAVKNEYKGKEMEGWEYENPLYKHLNLKTKNAYKVVLSGRYVNLEEGTGLVHCAPGHGKEDYEVGKEYGLDMPSPVDISGNLTGEAGRYAGKKARIVDEDIIKDLEKDAFIAHRLRYSHDYPLCWRCKSPLLMISQPQWFLKISEIQKKILKENEETNWVPSWMKLRMKAWLEGISDWPISRKRYWGAPLPIWLCEKCDERKVVGSIKELEKLSGKKVRDVHKPEIDGITLKCKCNGKMKRVEEVLDVWFDSGVSSWAALRNYGNKDNFEKFWPADLNIEGKDQVRGWWNSQFILSQIRLGKKPFENILVHGMILDLGKKKMSKSLGNIVSPQGIIDRYGRDYMRYYFARVSKGEDIAFDENEFLNVREFFRVLVNINNFISQLEPKKSRLEIEDKWILSRFNSFKKKVADYYGSCKFPEVMQELENFLIFDLSRTYIQAIRERADETYEILDEMRNDLLKLISPVCPFITESIWQDLRNKKIVKEESIHLSQWPKYDEKKIDKKLESLFEAALKVIEKGLAERDRLKIGLKWPLAKAVVETDKKLGKELQDIIARQLNVKKIELKETKKSELKVEFDTKLTAELEAEGYAREISRAVQAERKKAGLVKTDVIELLIVADNALLSMLKPQEKFIKERTNARALEITADAGSKKKYSNEKEFDVKDKRIRVLFSKV
ncbi:isoleucine--tRNA ligase [Candidatus Pacearchaeota archaeon]|nr:isoleucine--tRNA ligase [Candidatus Pacearchaeota archaeon]